MRIGTEELRVKGRSPRKTDVEDTVRRARWRLVLNGALAEGANAASFCLFLAILILLAGSELVDWRVVAAVGVAAALFAGRRAWRRTPSEYRTAQIVDARMELADTLSSAVFVKNSSTAPQFFRQTMLEEADRVAASTDIRRAVPFKAPRAAYATLGLFLVASSLFAWRLTSTEQLGFRKPIARFAGSHRPAEETVAQAKAQRPESIRDIPRPEESVNRNATRHASHEASKSHDEADRTLPDQGEPGKSADAQSKQSPEEGQKQEAQSQREQQQNADGRNGMPRQGEQGGQNRSEQRAGNNGPEQRQGGGLLEKFRDAVRSLVSKMSPQNGSAQDNQSAQNNSGKGQNQPQQQAADSQKNGGAQGSPGDADRNGDQHSQSSAAGKSSGGDPDHSRQPASGMGSEEGNKDVKNAEKVAAISKLTELFGKRAADITGEATVQVDSGRQSLRTPYGPQGSTRSSGSAEIGRDEVPIALQPYVQRYFEQVRNPQKK